ncbi:MAG: FAD-dependent oxidoreductase [Candidatus Devosia phytovorans]|uniref:FAD-dependent oxidoreductase n=1 Tax=Candidatus Devosia phytovorans TaxID=3121372 RepID=A0AAJ6B222_9HYPH|nr:FAD-dependent oxidoreductase [Devosia sp.]WEK06321.1 MAG: FAD-dependent oxidoreductase [Devosia sp.]
MRETDAHSTEGFAELVCSNSFRSDDHEQNAVGLLHEEMRRLQFADHARRPTQHQLPAGGALAVDRDGLLRRRHRAPSTDHPNITIDRGEESPAWPPEDWNNVIIATGPLTSPALAEAIRR